MPHKLESLYEDLTSVNPNWLEPKPSRKELAKAINARRRDVPTEVKPPTTVLFELIETNTEMPFHVSESKPFSVLKRTLSNGVEQYAFVWGESISTDDVIKVGASLDFGEWFELSADCKL